MRSSQLQITLRHTLRQRPDDPEDLPIVIPQSRLRVRVRGRQPRDIAVPSLLRRVQRRRRLDVRVGHGRAGLERRSGVLLQDQRGQVLGCLRDVGIPGGAVGGRLRAVGADGRGGGQGSRRSGVGLCGHLGGLFARALGEELLDVLVAALRGLPVRIAERARDVCDV